MATFVWVPDEAPTIDNEPRVMETQMGDGYIQAISFGLNTQPVTLSVAFTERTPGEIEAIDNFLREHRGAVSFDYSPQWRTRRNLLVNSEDFTASSWILSGATVTSNVAVSPYGSPTVDRLVENTANSSHAIYQTRTGSNEVCTMSAWVQAAGRTRMMLQFNNLLNSSASAVFDLSAGTVVSTTTAGADYSAVSAAVLETTATGFRRLRLTATKAAVTTDNAALIVLTDASGNTTYLGNGSSGINIWGAQVNTGATALEYEAVGPTWNPPEVGKFVCKKWSRTPRNCTMHSLTATFEQRFDQ